jgi:flagellar hook assembly protein FlgD
VARRSPVRIEILNVLSQTVRTVVDEVMTVGVYRATWDGKDSRGRDLASGVYVYRLTTGDSELTRKMVLLK